MLRLAIEKGHVRSGSGTWLQVSQSSNATSTACSGCPPLVGEHSIAILAAER
jgi:hypothetical protein